MEVVTHTDGHIEFDLENYNRIRRSSLNNEQQKIISSGNKGVKLENDKQNPVDKTTVTSESLNYNSGKLFQ